MLGMLFDHGLDTITTFMITSIVINVTRVYTFQNGFLAMIQLVFIFVGVYFTMMEEYFMHGLHLGLINAANECTFTIAGISILSYFQGNICQIHFLLICLRQLVLYQRKRVPVWASSIWFWKHIDLRNYNAHNLWKHFHFSEENRFWQIEKENVLQRVPTSPFLHLNLDDYLLVSESGNLCRNLEYIYILLDVCWGSSLSKSIAFQS